MEETKVVIGDRMSQDGERRRGMRIVVFNVIIVSFIP